MSDEPYVITERGDPRDRIANQQPLFDVDRTQPKACPIPGCGAIRLPDQHRVVTCAHDLDRDGPRPRGCLNTIRPEYQDVPY